MNLTGHHVLITGGAGGVGYALARAFAERGNHVTLLGRDAGKLERAARTLAQAETIQCDLTDPRQLASAAATLNASPHRPSILVNNAATQLNYDFTTTDPARALLDVDHETRANFTGLVQLTALTLPALRQHPAGAVVNITSGLAFAPKKTAAVYCATKAAVRAYTKALRYQMQDASLPLLVVDAVLPLVDTPMTAGRGEGRKVSPEFVASTILRGLARNTTDIHIGPARPFALLHRAAPRVAERLLRNS